MNTRVCGELGEKIAESFLAIKGYEIVDRNVRFARREVDLLARDGDALVAVEVKLRRGKRFGSAVEAVDRRKLSRLRVALSGLLREAGAGLRPRVDLVAIDISRADTRLVLEHYVGIG